MTRTRWIALTEVLLMGALCAAIMGAVLTGLFAYVAYRMGLPLWSEVPVTFIVGAMVLTFLGGIAGFTPEDLS